MDIRWIVGNFTEIYTTENIITEIYTTENIITEIYGTEINGK